MLIPDAPGTIRIIEDSLTWARRHPSYFFKDGKASTNDIASYLRQGVETLTNEAPCVERVEDWWVIASHNDWFRLGRSPIPEDLSLTNLLAFPEMGQNFVRPESVLAAFAKDIVVQGSAGPHVVKGTVETHDPVYLRLAESGGCSRVVAFRGIEA
ncbi:hypothetical protein [Aquabacterium humicola]|uniref:hypothetical protein n=1 Tax=Aquabacterium humicola TaxID=3237377 RepID=UPI0025432C28|nr:hypothetical protein [Rubrivivax pictus]